MSVIKQSFLNSLEGLFKEQAEALVESEDLIVQFVPSGTVVFNTTLYHNTVQLWLDEYNVVELAVAGNDEEVVDDT